MRVAVVDIGTNSTRLLVADVQHGHVVEVDRRTQVTRLGEGVDATGVLAEEALARVHATLGAYAAAIAGHRCEVATAILTSAARDAANGAELTAEVRERYGLRARTIDGEEEARLTWLGATSERRPGGGPLAVIDIGGGSTELIAGSEGEVAFHVSIQAGVVRQTERHLRHDPPEAHELQDLAAEVRTVLDGAVPRQVRAQVGEAVAVAGTATSCAAMAQELDPYDPARVHGYVLELGTLEMLLARLAGMTLPQRREVVGLHPDRAPTIVAGVVLLIEALRVLGLQRVEVSEHDILHGAALAAAAAGPSVS